MLARAAIFFALLLVSSIAGAQTIPLVTSTPMANGNTEYALGIQILMVMTVLTLLPAMLITMTAFTRILIVLAILRQALGTQQTPSNQIILGLSLFLTLFIMSPVIDVVWLQALTPYLDGDLAFDAALLRHRSQCASLCLVTLEIRILLYFRNWAAIRCSPLVKRSRCSYCFLLFL